MIRQILIFGFLFTCCNSYRQEFTLYSSGDDTLIVKSKRPDLLPLSPEIISNSIGRCYRGYWRTYQSTNYVNGITSGFYDTATCYSGSEMRNARSMRYLGPEDTDIESISFYNLTSQGGIELVIDKAAYAYIPFTPRSLLSTAWSNWTLYSGDNFDGTATCYVSTSYFHQIQDLTFPTDIKSVLKGCNRRIDKYFYADMLETPNSQINDTN